MVRSQSSTRRLQRGESGIVPALFTSTSRRPNASSGFLRDGLDLSAVSDVAGHGQRPSTRLGDLPGQGIEPIAASRGDRDTRTASRQRPRRRLADTTAGTGDDRNPVGKD